MNFIFVSPHFPKTYWNFCDRLHRNGVNVLGIGDAPFDEIPWELKQCLTEYYRVNDLGNYDEMLRAVAYFTFHYGKIDWIESNNEYWLEMDAQLRTDFNINTGAKNDFIERIKYKSKMKESYIAAGVPVARYHIVSTLAEARNLHDAGVAAVVGHAAQKQLQIAAFRRCMVQIMPVPGPADAVGAHQPDPPPVGLQNGCQQVGRRRLALRAGHTDHRHGAGRFAVEPRGQRRHGPPRVARQQHGTPGGQAGHIMGAEHRRGPGSDGLRRKVVAVGVSPGQTDEQRPPARHSGSHSRRT